ncbi:MAG: hypothetical protein AAFX87_07565 [Bacteroidota bacterium]
MLDYVKTILMKVSFDRGLFEKELRKALSVLITDEVRELKKWCYANFDNQYGSILNRYFIVASS